MVAWESLCDQDENPTAIECGNLAGRTSEWKCKQLVGWNRTPALRRKASVWKCKKRVGRNQTLARWTGLANATVAVRLLARPILLTYLGNTLTTNRGESLGESLGTLHF